MKKKINPQVKKIVFLLIIVIIFIMCVIFSLSYLINPNNYKSTIEKKFYSQSGRTLVLQGPISLSLVPNIHIIAKQVAISNPPEIGKGNFIQLDKIDFSLEMLPLLKGTLHFAHIELDGLDIKLIKSKNLNNWSFTKPDKTAKKRAPTIVLNRLFFRNTQISYKDTQQNKNLATKTFNLLINQESGEISVANDQLEFNKTSIDLDKNLQGMLNFKLTNKPQLNYKGEFWLKNKSLTNLADTFNVKRPNAIKHLNSDIKISSGITGTDTKLNLDNLQLSQGAANINGDIKIDTNPYQVSSNLKLNKLNLEDYINLEGFKLKIESIALVENFSTGTSSMLSNLDGQGSIKTGNITLYGLDVKSFSAGISKVIKDISIFKRLIAYTHTIETVKLLKQEFDKVASNKTKKYQDKTSLGQFNGALIAQKGTTVIKECRLKGGSIDGLCSGIVALNKKTVNVLIQARILPTQKQEQSVINYIYFPYYLKGRTDNLSTGLDWPYIVKQTTLYYKKK